MPVDIQTAQQIQTKVAEYAQSHEVYEDGPAYPYAEGFYDHCICFWMEAGYNEDDVRDTVEAAIEELKRTHA